MPPDCVQEMLPHSFSSPPSLLLPLAASSILPCRCFPRGPRSRPPRPRNSQPHRQDEEEGGWGRGRGRGGGHVGSM
eukprot:2992034-Pyramimonas_sp.AAC.1